MKDIQTFILHQYHSYASVNGATAPGTNSTRAHFRESQSITSLWVRWEGPRVQRCIPMPLRAALCSSSRSFTWDSDSLESVPATFWEQEVHSFFPCQRPWVLFTVVKILICNLLPEMVHIQELCTTELSPFVARLKSLSKFSFYNSAPIRGRNTIPTYVGASPTEHNKAFFRINMDRLALKVYAIWPQYSLKTGNHSAVYEFGVQPTACLRLDRWPNNIAIALSHYRLVGCLSHSAKW